MRTVSYEVRFPNGSVEITANYMDIKERKGRILRTILTEVDERTEKYLARSAVQRAKVRELLKAKRG